MSVIYPMYTFHTTTVKTRKNKSLISFCSIKALICRHFYEEKWQWTQEKSCWIAVVHISLKYNYNESTEKNKKEKLTSFLDISFHYSWQKGVNTQQNVVACLETLQSCTYILHMWNRFHIWIKDVHKYVYIPTFCNFNNCTSK